MANSYLNRNITSNGNAKTWTWSYWVKRAKLGSWMNTHNLGGTANRDYGAFDSSNRLEFAHYNSGYQYRFLTNRVFRDVSAWYHIVIAMDTTQSTESNRTKIYVNGVQETSFNTATYPSQNQNTRGSQDKIMVGADFDPGNYFDGYQSHVAFVDGQALAPTVFGETDSTSGIWKFKSPSGVTWGTNGFHLKFENSGNLGLDSSGNSNTFTVNGNGRQALDTPSNVSATLNPLNMYYGNSTLSNGNNTQNQSASSGNYAFIPSTLGFSSGKWYWEMKCVSGHSDNWYGTGITSSPANANNNWLGQNANDYSMYGYSYGGGLGSSYTGGARTNQGLSFTAGDIIGVAVDCDNLAIYFSKNGTWMSNASSVQGVPTSGSSKTGSFFTITAPSSTSLGFYFPAVCYFDAQNAVQNVNFGNGYFGTTAITSAGSNGNGSLFEYDVPSGYYALNTKNINTYG